MNKEDFKLVYMATADFALPALKRLVEGGYNIRAVVTMPDKPAGRGLKLQESSIKRFAVEHDIEVLQPERLRDPNFIARLNELAPDLALVVAFRMLPEEVWRLPRLGTINLHGSLLPRYRGAAPIHWAVINGDEETGVSTFQLKHEIDTGDVLLQAKTPIAYTDTTGDVHDRLMHIGAQLLEDTVRLVMDGAAKTVAQDQLSEPTTHAPKLNKENTRIDWTKSAAALYNFVRGLYPYPSAWCELTFPGHENPITCKVHAAEVLSAQEQHTSLAAGTVLLTGRKYIDVVCGSGVLRLLMIQPAGKKCMAAADFINGLR